MRNLNRRFLHIVTKSKKKIALNGIMWLKGIVLMLRKSGLFLCSRISGVSSFFFFFFSASSESSELPEQ